MITLLFSRHSSSLVLRSLAFIVLLPLIVFSQQYGKISGRVKDAKSGEWLPSVNVVVKGTSLGAATDGRGSYAISQVPLGTYMLVFSAVSSATTARILCRADRRLSPTNGSR
ncbi:MAG: carboxypeptidase-like regulatory domain-containing protein [Ignavibacteriae bacterium]|nr:carboxypeptidase-like regulatory domain-containing protein [Ignavibacteria bacterium]MBI3364216.1 carboxypeptidase-like regulatory domain-containing protein [Ignavibacteriota bacterium]